MPEKEVDYSKYNFPEYAKAIRDGYERERQEKKERQEALEEGGRKFLKNMQDGKVNPMGDTYKKGGKVKSSASKRADGCCIRGKTRA